MIDSEFTGSAWSTALVCLDNRVASEPDDENDTEALLARLAGIMSLHIDKDCWDEIILAAEYGQAGMKYPCPCDDKEDLG